MKIEVFVFNPIQENTYVVIDDTTNKCGIIDAGCRSRMEKVKLKKFIEQNGLTPVALLNTHLHFDHIYGNKFILETYGLKTYASPKDQFFIDTFIDQLNIFQIHFHIQYKFHVINQPDIIQVIYLHHHLFS